jgi:hypothetical protein
LRVELQPGFAREIFVRDAATGRRLAGVAIRDERGSVLAQSAADGSALLSSAEWPGPLELTRVGYAPRAWDPSSHWYTFSPYVDLEPSR